MPELIVFDFVRNWRPRSDDAHVSTQNVKELRQFVEAGLSQNLTHASNSFVCAQLEHGPFFITLVRIWPAGDESPLIFTMRGVVRAHPHRTEFIEEKNSPVHPDAFLLIKDRPTRIELDQQSDQ